MSEKKKTIDALISGGQATAGPPLGPILGPMGLNVLAVVNRINELTKPYAGMKVPVKVTVDQETKQFEVEVGTPTVGALVVKELSIQKGSGTPNTQKVGDLNFEQLVKITKLKQDQTLARSFKSAVKEVAGSCVSIGITIEGKDPKEVQKEIDEGAYDKYFNP
ncbi:50S ribosomal protein L11 [Candidatus Bathyarchaeota archaeon]|jgi:large subunit ribosomal protein L11|nr:50S ribosomal protein L11 [Candidatus Bathyarchaeota archaeon]